MQLNADHMATTMWSSSTSLRILHHWCKWWGDSLIVGRIMAEDDHMIMDYMGTITLQLFMSTSLLPPPPPSSLLSPTPSETAWLSGRLTSNSRILKVRYHRTMNKHWKEWHFKNLNNNRLTIRRYFLVLMK